MKATIIKISPFTSRHGGKCYLVCFKTDSGKSYNTYISPSFRNFKRWKKVLNEGVILSGLKLVKGKNKLINADSKFIIEDK